MDTKMTDTTRRGFLLGLVATAVATQLPTLPEAKQAKLTENLVDRLGIQLQGATPESFGIEEAGNGWYRVWTRATKGGDGEITVTGNSGPDGGGIAVVPRDRPDLAQEMFDEGYSYVASEITIQDDMPSPVWNYSVPISGGSAPAINLSGSEPVYVSGQQLEQDSQNTYTYSMYVKFAD